MILTLLFSVGSAGEGSPASTITEIQPNYKPWLESVFQPASPEIASLLFATQAALGAGVVGYAIGRYQGRTEAKAKHRDRS